jgi:hypothetical protein
MIQVMRRIPEKYSIHWLAVAALLFGVYFMALRGSRLLLGLEISPQNVQGFIILALLMSLAVVAGGFFGAKIYSITAFIFSAIGVAYLLIVSGTQTYQGWTDLISVVGFMFWGGLAVGAGIIVQLICSIRASRRRLKEILAKENDELEEADEWLQREDTQRESAQTEDEPDQNDAFIPSNKD